MKEKFISFLKKHRALRKFTRNLKEGQHKSLDNVVIKWSDKPDKFILDAFYWDDSPERHEYWDKLNDLWDNEYRK